ncbi:MAG: hypothetical protein NTW21_35725 [Verrucomicrobia bacterium]|nr:hypothetical protein [Verrucomicrobiota bacterium]
MSTLQASLSGMSITGRHAGTRYFMPLLPLHFSVLVIQRFRFRPAFPLPLRSQTNSVGVAARSNVIDVENVASVFPTGLDDGTIYSGAEPEPTGEFPRQCLDVGMIAQVLQHCDFLKCLDDLCLAIARHATQIFDGAPVQDDPAHFKGRVRLSMKQDR